MQTKLATVSPRSLTILFAAAVASAAGCSQSPYCSVSGSVTFEGAALEEGMLMFVPDQRGGDLKTVSALIEAGQFTIDRSKGLLPGKYRVAITAERPSGRQIEADPGSGVMIDEYVQVIPERYNAQSQLLTEISGDRSDLVFELDGE